MADDSSVRVVECCCEGQHIFNQSESEHCYIVFTSVSFTSVFCFCFLSTFKQHKCLRVNFVEFTFFFFLN